MHDISEIVRVGLPMASMGGTALAIRFITARQRKRDRGTTESSSRVDSLEARQKQHHETEIPAEGGTSWASS